MLLRGQKDLMNLSVRPAGLAFLVGRSWGTIQFWTKYKGLPGNGDGTYNLKAALDQAKENSKQADREVGKCQGVLAEINQLNDLVQEKSLSLKN